MFDRSHQKYEAPKFEDLELHKAYAISLNPLDEYKVSQLPIVWVRRQYDALQQIIQGVELVLYPEVSPTGRFHFHGTITINDKWEYIKTITNLSTYGTYCIRKISEPNKQDDAHKKDYDIKNGYTNWTEYCLKQMLDWEPLFKNNVLSYPIVCKGAVVLPKIKDKKKKSQPLIFI